MPESKMVASDDPKTAQEGAKKGAQGRYDWLVPIAVLAIVISTPLLIWQLMRRKASKPLLFSTIGALCAGIGFLIWRRINRPKGKTKIATSPASAPANSESIKESEPLKDITDSQTCAKTDSLAHYGRFTVQYGDEIALVTDTKQSCTPYQFKKDSKAWKFILLLLKNHATGTDQICKTDCTWIGAFQGRNKMPARFCREQIFMLPRWDVSKGRYLNKQFAGRWRLWMDDELSISKEERLARFRELHPHGYAR